MRASVSSLLLSGASLALGASRTSPPSGCVHVAKSGGGDYSSVQAAVDSNPSCVFLDQGTYTEQVYVTKPLTIYGYTEDDTSYAGNRATITYNNHADAAGSNDATGTLRVHADGVKVYNVNIVNSYGKGDQAIALSAQASSGYYGCRLQGFQDTLLANEGRQYYGGCEVAGATDFVFGQRAAAWFAGCALRVRAGGYYVTANGRDAATDNASFYVFDGGDVAAADGESVPAGSYYLGRPWRPYSRVVFQRTTLSNVINAAGWSLWNDDPDVANVYYGEYDNSGAGASTSGRVSWSKQLSSAVSIDTVLGSGYASEAWYDASYPS
ncbi:pectinesterase [Xylariomycetidae sp. FL0641]|nr:pectinesterase [Xylariomycetidae sp. FL0641]